MDKKKCLKTEIYDPEHKNRFTKTVFDVPLQRQVIEQRLQTTRHELHFQWP